MGTAETTSRDRTEFGQRLRAARQHAKLTQAQLAERAGISQSGITFLETKANASEVTVALAHACGVRAIWLATGAGQMVGPETAADVAALVAREPGKEYTAAGPSSAKDYRTIAHTLAASLEESGIAVSLKQFLSLADDVFNKLNDSAN